MRGELILLFGCGLLVLTYGLFWEASEPARLIEKLGGAAAVIAAWAIVAIPRMRQAELQPYTTTDWLKGRRPPFNPNPLSRWA